jgi:UDP-glucose 4-epimerase
MQVLVTGGAGYIGSHTCVELLNAGFAVVVVDNLFNSCQESLERVQQITGKTLEFIKLDLLDLAALERVFSTHHFSSVIHFAGLKAVGESVSKPLFYYHNNITGTLNLLEAMTKSSVKNLVFSSSATVYGQPQSVPITEDFPVHPTNPYGHTKAMVEQILKDLYVSDHSWNIALLRYFNPVGAHPSGRIGENPSGIPNNLMPYITQVATGKLTSLSIYGNDYPTPDGTGIRDYIHVQDLSLGHLAALKKLDSHPGLVTYNLGTGKGFSVLEVIHAFEQVSGKTIPYTIVARRPGDIATCYADVTKAKTELNWSAQKSLPQMCQDAWNWQSQNPQGY